VILLNRSGAEILLDCLAREGVELLFGYPGSAVIHIYDALYGHPTIRNILVRHEQGAIHAADGYARSTGKTGVCLATSGPGATNLITGIATAYQDSIPLVIISGQVSSFLLGRDSFQEADIRGMTLPITKHNELVTRLADLPRAVKEAFYIARTGRPGPVLIDLTKDVTQTQGQAEYPDAVHLPGYQARLGPRSGPINEAAAAIAAAGRPVLCAGGGVISSGAVPALRRLAETLAIPVAATLMGLTAFPAGHPLSLGLLGANGTAAARWAVNQADLLIAVGVRSADRVTPHPAVFAPQARLISIDIDPAELEQNRSSQISLAGDAKTVLSMLLERLKPAGRPEWLAEIAARKVASAPPASAAGLQPRAVMAALGRITGGGAFICSEAEQPAIWTARFYPFREPRTFIAAGGLGTVGFAFPAAVGAQAGNPGRPVVAVVNAAGVQMCLQELATLVANQLPVKALILNRRNPRPDRPQGLAPESQPDFVKLAEAYGAKGFRINIPERLEEILGEALAASGPALVDCPVDWTEEDLPALAAAQG
jgi:acetolactate synthase-1/2/3 large subunit